MNCRYVDLLTKLFLTQLESSYYSEAECSQLFTMDCEGKNKSDDVHGSLENFDMPNDVYLIFEELCHKNKEPVSPQGPPIRENYPGIANFEVFIDGSHTKKKKFLYSDKLNRIYVDMGVDFPLKFNWDESFKLQNMFVRATVVFSDPGQTQKKVEACYQHSNFSTIPSKITGRNVLRSGRELGVPEVFYCGRHDDPNSWYSVVVAASPGLEHPYQFICKNSCTSGINRRNIEIIFTLEDYMGYVHGRHSVGARVCSAPRRDLARDELALEGHTSKRPAPQEKHTSKKIKIEVSQQQHNTIVTLPQISVVGIPAVISGLQVMLSMQEQALAIKTENKETVDDLNNCISDLKKSIDYFETEFKE